MSLLSSSCINRSVTSSICNLEVVILELERVVILESVLEILK
jgi:hypothetical protein